MDDDNVTIGWGTHLDNSLLYKQVIQLFQIKAVFGVPCEMN